MASSERRYKKFQQPVSVKLRNSTRWGIPHMTILLIYLSVLTYPLKANTQLTIDQNYADSTRPVIVGADRLFQNYPILLRVKKLHLPQITQDDCRTANTLPMPYLNILMPN